MLEFWKVYFPRIIKILSIVISNLIKFESNFYFITFYLYFYFQGAAISLNMWTFYCLFNCFNGRIGIRIGNDYFIVSQNIEILVTW
jgi:lipopolysaccharide transport system permease protein